MKILAVFIMILQFTDGSDLNYTNQQFNSLQDCLTYQRLFLTVQGALIGQYLEDKMIYKENEIHTQKQVQYATGICRKVIRIKE